jgi:hypothetical protein
MEIAVVLVNQNIATMEYVKKVMFCPTFMYSWIISSLSARCVPKLIFLREI